MRDRKERGEPLDEARGRPAALPPNLPLILLLFVGSGAAALIYEVVWFQLLQLVIGGTAVSLAVLLATFMGGLCLGSLLAGKMAPNIHPLRTYGYLELGIGACGLLILLGLPALGTALAPATGPGFSGILARGVLCGVLLLPPTILMGATLPVVARWVGHTREGVSWLGLLYGGNIAGAVLGALLSGFYLLRLYDMTAATWVAVAINVAIGGVAVMVSGRDVPRPQASIEPADASPGWVVPVVTALSGFTALGAQVVWTRVLALLLGGTVYTFSMIAAVFLAGLGIGSAVAARIIRLSARPGLLLALSQVGAAAGAAWGAMMINRAFPYWPIDPALAAGPWFNIQIDLLRVVLAVLPAACCWGASFPLALAAAAPRAGDTTRLVGRLYAANTIGAVAGALLFSLLLIPAIGTSDAQRVIILVAAASAMLLAALPTGAGAAAGRRAAVAVGALLVGGAGAASVAPIPPEVIAYGRQITTFRGNRYLYTGEGLNSSIAVSEMAGGVRNFHVSGKVEASSEILDMRLQRLLGHVSALMHRDPKSVLVVGFGAGVTAGSFVLHRGVERIVICEIEPLIPQRVAPFFSTENNNVLNDPRVEVVYDDARHFILTTDEKFDVITSDPIHPWVKGASALYTREYFEHVKAHLNPGGVVTQWVPLYQSSEEVIRSEVATFFEVFPNGTIWSNQYSSGRGYDIVLLGTNEPLRIDPESLFERLEGPDYKAVDTALRQVEIPGVPGLLATYAGQASDLRPWLTGAQINTDRNLRLEYLAGMANNIYDPRIYQNMMRYRRFPDEMFVGENADEWRDALRQLPAPGQQPGAPQGAR